MTTPNRLRYFRSLSDELRAQSTRVRDLIGDAHWLSDGHQKEYALLELLRRHLPSGFAASRGFVISPTQSSVCSKEQDILVVDTLIEAPAFSQGNLVITFPSAVVAAISVKSTMKEDAITDSIEGLASVLQVCRAHCSLARIWCGAYFYENSFAQVATPATHFERGLDKYCDGVLPTGDNSSRLFFAEATGLILQAQVDRERTTHRKLSGHHCQELSTSFFLASLMNHVAMLRGRPDCSFALASELEGASPQLISTIEWPALVDA